MSSGIVDHLGSIFLYLLVTPRIRECLGYSRIKDKLRCKEAVATETA